MQEIEFAVTGIKTAPTGGNVIIISLQSLERAWRSSVDLALRGARSFRTGYVMLGYDTAYAPVARRHPAARTALLHSHHVHSVIENYGSAELQD